MVSVNPTWAVLSCLLVTAAIEVATCVLRFSLRLEACRHTAAIGGFTLGLRIHHAYVGLAVVALGVFFVQDPLLAWSLIVGVALVFSDLIHHFLVLWPTTGSPQFDLFYPEAAD